MDVLHLIETNCVIRILSCSLNSYHCHCAFERCLKSLSIRPCSSVHHAQTVYAPLPSTLHHILPSEARRQSTNLFRRSKCNCSEMYKDTVALVCGIHVLLQSLYVLQCICHPWPGSLPYFTIYLYARPSTSLTTNLSFCSPGSIVPVAPGLFRNYWLPKRWASYLSASASKPKDIVAERDFSFGAHSKDTITPPNDPSQASVPQERREGNKSVTTAAARAALVSPERALEILDEKLPLQILFYRVPITEPSSAATTETTPSPNSTTEPRRQHASPAAAALAAASSPASPPVNVGDSLHAEPIFGSVSTGDIADSIKALLAQEEEGARIVLGAEDVTILTGEGVEGGDRVKALGDFRIEVRVRGGKDTMRRIVSVRPVKDEN